MIVGREKEIKKLQGLYESDSAELVALYGRCRVGKTYLIDNVFENKIFFRHAGLSPIEPNTMKDQLLHFHRSLKLSGWEKDDIPASWRDFWRKAFSAVIPGYHQNKEHWNTVILDGSVSDQDIKRMIAESYDLVVKR